MATTLVLCKDDQLIAEYSLSIGNVGRCLDKLYTKEASHYFLVQRPDSVITRCWVTPRSSINTRTATIDELPSSYRMNLLIGVEDA